MWLRSLWEWIVGRLWKGLEILAEKGELEELRLYLMGDSVQSSEDQNADRNSTGTDPAQKVSHGKKDCIGCWTPDNACYTLAVFCSCPETLPETKIKDHGLMNLAEEISRQSNIEAVAWLLLQAFSQIYVENQEQRAQKNELKCFEFGQEGSSNKTIDCKDRAKEILIAEKEQENRKDGLRASQEAAELKPLQPQGCKNERFCLEKTAPEHHVLEWQQPREVGPWNLVHGQWTPTPKRKESLSTADFRFWHHPCSAGFRCMQNGKALRSGKLPPRVQKKAWETRQCAPERAVCKPVSIKPKVCWRPQKFGETRNMDRLRKASRSENSRPKKKAMEATTTSSAIGMEPPKFFGINDLAQIVGNAGSGNVGLNVYSAGSGVCVVPIPCYPPICNFWNGNINLVPLNVGSI